MLNQTETLRLIRCDTADETYGLDMSWVRSIQRTDRLRRNPETEPETQNSELGRHSPVGWLPGNEGDIPVFSLASQFGRPPKEGGALQRIVVLNAEPRPWALLVDRVSQVIQVPADRVVPLPSIVVNPFADYFQGVIKLDEGLILFLSPERLHHDASLSPEPRPKPAEGPVKEPDADTPSSTLHSSSSILHPPSILHPANAGGQRRSNGQIVIFSIAEPHPAERALSFGLSISQVPEILEPLPLTPVPAAPAFVLGLVNWRDWPVPVIDLASRLGLAPEAKPSANGRTRLIIARDKGHILSSPKGHVLNAKEGSNQGALAGFLVRPAIRVLRLPIAHQPCSRILSLNQALTRSIVELENETLVIPDIRGILFGPAQRHNTTRKHITETQ